MNDTAYAAETRGLARRDPVDVLTACLLENAAAVLDIGCGDGWLVRALAGRGYDVTGIDPSAEQLERAREADPAACGRYLQGGAESLPVDDASVEVAVFFNSLHHVPVVHTEQALREAARVLRPEGLLYVQEPMAAGPSYELSRPVDDECELYEQARIALETAVLSQGLFTRIHEQRFVSGHGYADFQEFCDRMIRIDPGRAPALQHQIRELRAAFDRLGEREADGWRFDQVLRVDVLRAS